jgi:transcriptional regulator with XRE-family HTH domain
VDTIKQWRRRKGWTQADLAREAGVHLETVSGIETGNHEPRPSTLQKLAGAFDVEVEELFDNPKAPTPASSPKETTEARRTRAFDMVHELVSRQIEEDRQAIARAHESGCAQGSFVRHENEAMNRLLEYPPEVVAEAFVDLMRDRVQLEQELQLQTDRASAAGDEFLHEQYLAFVQDLFPKARDKGAAPPTQRG